MAETTIHSNAGQGKVINRFGRQGGRGLRPWLLLPKVLAVGILIGSVVSILALLLILPRDSVAAERMLYQIVVGLLCWVSLPALLVAGLGGIGLLMLHPVALLSMRWLMVKLILIVILIFGGYLSLAWPLHLIEQRISADPRPTAPLWYALMISLTIILAGLIATLLLGRIKPRLGQPIKPRPKR